MKVSEMGSFGLAGVGGGGFCSDCGVNSPFVSHIKDAETRVAAVQLGLGEDAVHRHCEGGRRGCASPLYTTEVGGGKGQE